MLKIPRKTTRLVRVFVCVSLCVSVCVSEREKKRKRGRMSVPSIESPIPDPSASTSTSCLSDVDQTKFSDEAEDHGVFQQLQSSLDRSNLFQAIREAPKLGFFRSKDDAKTAIREATRQRVDTHQINLWHIAFAKDCNVYEQWLRTEREMEKKWEDLEERTFTHIIGFGKRTSHWTKYDPPDGPKLVPCRPGLSSMMPWTCNRILLSRENAPPFCSDGVTIDPDPTFVNASEMTYSFIAAAN